jgi:hypothetical protein
LFYHLRVIALFVLLATAASAAYAPGIRDGWSDEHLSKFLSGLLSRLPTHMNATPAALISFAVLPVAPAPAQEADSSPAPRRPRWNPDLEKVHDPSTVMVPLDETKR